MNSTHDVNESDLVYGLRCRIEDLERALGSKWRAPSALNLTALQARVLGMIVKRRSIDLAAIYDVLYGEELDPPEDGESVIRVVVHATRRKLRPHNIHIKTEYGRARLCAAYAIDHDSLTRLNALYAPGEPSET